MRNNRERGFFSAAARMLICLAAGLLAGFFVLLIAAWAHLGKENGAQAGSVLALSLTEGFLPLLRGGLDAGLPAGLTRAAPVMLSALSVALCGQAGLFQLGAAGAYALGTAAMLWGRALNVPWPACLAGATVMGAVFGWIPGLLKARFGTHEALTTALLGWGGIYAARALAGLAGEGAAALEAPAWWPLALAAGLGAAIWLYLKITVRGYEIRVMGQSEKLARAAGIQVKKHTMAVMALSGAIGGLAGGIGCMLFPQAGVSLGDALTGNGALGLAAAALGNCHPLSSLGAGLAAGWLQQGVQAMNTSIFPPEAGEAALFLALALASCLVIGRRERRGGA